MGGFLKVKIPDEVFYEVFPSSCHWQRIQSPSKKSGGSFTPQGV